MACITSNPRDSHKTNIAMKNKTNKTKTILIRSIIKSFIGDNNPETLIPNLHHLDQTNSKLSITKTVNCFG